MSGELVRNLVRTLVRTCLALKNQFSTRARAKAGLRCQNITQIRPGSVVEVEGRCIGYRYSYRYSYR
jgi:hypothetical protein